MGEQSPEPASTPTGAVFLSYASQDADAARRICDALRAAGIEVWFDQSELRGGDAWDRKIRDQIRHCALFIPIISAHSQARLEGYFRREWKFAVERKRDIADELAFLLPVVIDETPERGASVPEGFHEVQWTRLPGGAASQDFIKHVSRLLTGHPDPPNAGVQALQPSSRPASTRPAAVFRSAAPRRMWLVLIAAVTGAIVAYIGIDRYLLHKGTQPSAAPATAAIDKSIAVLPFADLSENHDQQYLADGLSDELLDALARIPGLRVINRPSSFQFRDRSADVRDIGSKLGATHIVEGSVRRSGDAVRVTAQLIRAADRSEEWSRSFDSALENALQLQSRIALALARELEVSVAGTTSVAAAQTTNAQAHDLYLRGLHAVDSFTADGESEAADLFQRAIELDPNFVSAYEMLGYAHTLLAADGFVPVESGFAQLHSDAQWLLARDPHSLMGHWLLAYYHLLYTRDWSAAEREVSAALAANRNGWKAPYLAGRIAMAQGQLERAERLFKTSLVSDPLDADSLCELSLVLRGMHRLQEAQQQVRRCLAITPTYPGASAQLALTLLDQGQGPEALANVAHEVDEGLRWAVSAEIEAALGQSAQAEAALHRAEQGVARVRPTFIALAYASMGQSDEALRWLDRANQQHDPWLIYLKSSPETERLAHDPRYVTLLHTLGLPP
jgi:TolB-like protein